MSRFAWLETGLSDLAKDGAARDPSDWMLRGQVEARAESLGLPFVDASSNDYLGYASGRVGAGAGAVRVGPDSRDGSDGWFSVQRGSGSCVANVSRETLAPSRKGDPRPARLTHPAAPCPQPPVALGTGASRLLGGSHVLHNELEACLADWVGQESSLLFSSGYAANLGLLSSIAGVGDVIFSDALNHASIIDGCRLSRATVRVYPHLDLLALRKLLEGDPLPGRRFVVTESYFSMDGDTPDLRQLRSLCDEHSACLVIDEAHALGVFGSRGAGLATAAGVQPDITVGTLGKAIGLQGAFVAGPHLLRTWLWNRARSFVFSTGTSPALAAETLFHVKQAHQDDEARALLAERSATVRKALLQNGIRPADHSHGPIVPIVLGDNHTAVAAAAALRDRGILIYPVRPPTVPAGTARLRLTLTAASTKPAFQHLIDTLALILRP